MHSADNGSARVSAWIQSSYGYIRRPELCQWQACKIATSLPGRAHAGRHGSWYKAIASGLSSGENLIKLEEASSLWMRDETAPRPCPEGFFREASLKGAAAGMCLTTRHRPDGTIGRAATLEGALAGDDEAVNDARFALGGAVAVVRGGGPVAAAGAARGQPARGVLRAVRRPPPAAAAAVAAPPRVLPPLAGHLRSRAHTDPVNIRSAHPTKMCAVGAQCRSVQCANHLPQQKGSALKAT